jgi:hypothetical protein
MAGRRRRLGFSKAGGKYAWSSVPTSVPGGTISSAARACQGVGLGATGASAWTSGTSAWTTSGAGAA